MISVQEAIEIVKSFTYKPGFGIWAFSDDHRLRFVVWHPTKDARDPEKRETLQTVRSMPIDELKDATVETIKQKVLEVVTENELHERDEWLKWNGMHLNNPHPELQNVPKVDYAGVNIDDLIAKVGGIV